MIERIRKVLEKNPSIKKISEDVDITRQTTYKIVKKIANGIPNDSILPSVKNKNSNLNSDIKNKISQLLLRDSSYTQKEIVNELSIDGIVKSQSTISRTLKDMIFSRKRLVKIPVERNTIKNIETRQIYARSLGHINDNNLVFLDETSMNLHQTRNYGYSPINSKAIKFIKANRGTNISCMVAIKNSGIISYEIRDGPYNGDTFIDFIKNKLLIHFLTHPNDILIMDNCKFHHRKDVLSVLHENNITFKFTPPYSPQLNPIEEYFSFFKSKMSAIMICNLTRNELKDKIKMFFENEIVVFDGWFRNMRIFLDKALARQEFI